MNDDNNRGGAGMGENAESAAVDVNGVDLGRVWTGVAAEVWRRQPGPVERLAARLLRSPGLARALLTTPSLLLPWLISTVVIFGVGGMIDLAGGEPLVWVLAPGITAVGVSYAYGPGVDPAWELASSMAISERMVLLVRAVAVFAVNACLGLVASGITYWATASGLHSVGGHAAAAVTFAWLIPMTAVCALTLAVAVVARSASVGALTGVLAWAATVLASRASAGAFTAAVTDTAAYLPYLAVAACATAVIGYASRTPRRTQ